MLKPVIEIRQIKYRRNRFRSFICCVHPGHGKVIASKMLGSTLTSVEVAERVLEFTKFVERWLGGCLKPLQGESSIDRCESVLL